MQSSAEYVRIFEPNPTDDLVLKREAAVKELADRLRRRRSVTEILGSVNELCQASASRGAQSDSFAISVESAIQVQSPSFVRDGRDLEILVCALASFRAVLNGASPSGGLLTTTDLIANALWLGLSFQGTRSEQKLEALRNECMCLAMNHVRTSAESSRRRVPVPEFSLQLGEDGTTNLEAKFKSGTQETIKALRSNSALDREEIDVLWWVLEAWSSILNLPFNGAPGPAAAVAGGLELAKLLRRVPSDAHRNLAQRLVTDNAEISLTDLVAALEDKRDRFSDWIEKPEYVDTYPSVFCLLAAIRGAKGKTGAKTKRTLRDWTARALVESTTVRLIDLLPAELT